MPAQPGSLSALSGWRVGVGFLLSCFGLIILHAERQCCFMGYGDKAWSWRRFIESEMTYGII